MEVSLIQKPEGPGTTTPKQSIKSIGLLILHSQANLFLELALRLKRQYGSDIHIYCRSETEAAWLKSDPRCADVSSITNANIIPSVLRRKPRPLAETTELARRLEAEIGETINNVAVTHRHLGRGWSPGSSGYPRSQAYGVNLDYAHYLDAVTAQLEFWQHEIRSKQLTLLIDAGKEGAVMARAAGIAFRWFGYARLRRNYMWLWNEYQQNPLVKRTYDQLTEWPPAELSGVYVAAANKYQEIWGRMSWRRYFPAVSRGLVRMLRQTIRRRPDDPVLSLDEVVAYPYRVRRAAAKLKRLARVTTSDLQGTPFVYFALQKEPEQALLMAAPEATDQFNLIIEISRNLPAGAKLAVAEHIVAIGRRPPTFYDQITAMPNVVMLNPTEKPMNRILRAAATITVAGTVAHEAAVLGKPAIVFGQHVLPNFLPHVMTVRNRSDLARYLSLALNGQIDLEQAKIDGARYEHSVRLCSFDLGAFGERTSEWGFKSGEAEASILEQELIRSLDMAADEATARHA